MKKNITILAALLLSAYLTSFSQTVIPGGSEVYGTNPDGVLMTDTIDSPETWGPGIIDIYDDILITDGGELTIQPGTQLVFQGAYKIDVTGTGRILAEGTATESILFTVADTTGFYNWSHDGWSGLRFGRLNPMSGSADSSILKYCILEYGKSDNGGALYLKDFNKVVIDRNTFKYNFAGDDGGALYLYGVQIFITNSIISDNKTSGSSGDNGGGIYFQGPAGVGYGLNLIGCLVTNNSAYYGGGIYCTDQYSGTNSNIILTNSTFAQNAIASGSGTGVYINNCYSYIKNCIFLNPSVDINVTYYASIEIGYSNLEGGPAGISVSGSTLNYEGGDFYATCIEADPKFVNPTTDAGPFSPSVNGGESNWQLMAVSPCLDEGTPDTTGLNLPNEDLAGNPRITKNVIDMGAYERFEGYNLNPPTNLQASVNGSDVALTWMAASTKGLLGYAVYRDYENIEPLTSNTSFQEYGLIQGLYDYHVTAIYDEGESWPDGPIEVSVGGCHGGFIDEPVVWGPGEVKVCEDVVIATGGELTIQPGSQLVFQGAYKIDVTGTGRILAEGTATDSILFTVADTTGFYNWSHEGWAGLRFGRLYAMSSGADSSIFKYCTFEYGKSDDGGALYLTDFDKVVIDRNTFKYNFATDDGGALYLYGVQIFITNSIISDNKTSGSSGAYGGGIYYLGTVGSHGLNLINSLVSNNSAYYGGGIYCTDQYNGTNSDVILTSSTFAQNAIASGSGTGVYIDNCHSYIKNCIFLNPGVDINVTYYASIEIGYSLNNS